MEQKIVELADSRRTESLAVSAAHRPVIIEPINEANLGDYVAAVQRVVVVTSTEINDQLLPWLDAVLQPDVVSSDLLTAIVADDAVQAAIGVLHPLIASLQEVP